MLAQVTRNVAGSAAPLLAADRRETRDGVDATGICTDICDPSRRHASGCSNFAQLATV